MYGGTKSELERLVKDANDYKESIGEVGDLSSDNFADVIDAINAVQRKMGITGATAEEAMGTIEGSVNMAKSAWEDWVTGLGRDDADMSKLTDNLIQSIGAVANNLGPVVSRIASSLMQNLPSALSAAATAIAPALAEVFAGLFNTVTSSLGLDIQIEPQQLLDMFNGIKEALSPLAETVLPAIQSFIEAVWPAISEFAETILPPLVDFLSQLAATLLEMAETILPPIIEFLTPIVEKFTELATWLLEQLQTAFENLSPAIEGIQGFLEGVAGAAQQVIEWFQGIIDKVGEVGSAIANSPVGQFVGGAVDFVGGILGFARGGFTNGPYIAGEDPRYPNEAVISFNPAYRQQNLRYWQMAGHMLGATSATMASTTAAGGGGGTVIDLSGITYAPKVEVRGNASREDIVAALRQDREEFADFLAEVMAGRAEVVYA